MRNYPKDFLLHYKSKFLRQNQRKDFNMMFPLGNDVTVECSEPAAHKSKPGACKLIRLLACVLVCIIICLVIRHSTIEVKEEFTVATEKPDGPAPVCTVELGDKMKEEIKTWIQKEVQKSSKVCAQKINPEHMRNIVKEEIKKHQKVQLKPDFASASAGGMVLDASPTWTEGYAFIYFLFIPIRSTAPPPSIVLEPTRQAGDCWPMKGQKGFLLIQLAARANIVGFTVEHIDPAMSLSGATPEAPSNFSVYGIEEPETYSRKYLLGVYLYDNKNDEESQYFRVQNVNRKSFLYIQVEISSNHGNEKYTCLYRFQVHGFIDRAYHCQEQ